jgi:hypothetical protein
MAFQNYFEADRLPPSFAGEPWLYLATVFSLLLIVLLVLEWLWRLVWSFFETPVPFKSPSMVLRTMLVLLLTGALIRSGPDLYLLMAWDSITPPARQAIAVTDNQLDAIAFVFMSLAWLIARLGEPMVEYQLRKEPLPVHLWPTWKQLKRPLKIGVGVFAIAFALTFLK